MTFPAEATRPDIGFIDALHVSGPADEHAGKLMLFGQFVGSWDLEWAGTGANGEPATATGELHFGWVLGGRAVQDIWIVPGRDPVLGGIGRRTVREVVADPPIC